MAKSINIPVSVSLNIIFLEIIWMIAVASLLSLYALYDLYQPSQSSFFDSLFIKWIPVVGLIFFLLPFIWIPFVLFWNTNNVKISIFRNFHIF